MQNEQTIEQPSKLSIGLKYGMISSLAGIMITVIKSVMGQNPFGGEYDWSFFVSILIGIGAIVLAHKEFKDKGNGFLSYGEALAIGCIIGLVGWLVTIIFTYVYVNFVDQTVMSQALDKALADMEKQNQPEQAMEMTKKYFNMFFWGGLIVMVALFNFVLALLVSIFTQKRNPNPVF